MPTTNINLGFVAAAAGTVDAITATYSPAPAALTDKMLVWFRASGANTSATPTFNPNSLGAHTIVKNGGQALVAGDIPAAGAIVGLVYDLANTRWEIIGYFDQSGWVKVGTNVILKTITDNVGIGTATPGYKLDVAGDFISTKTTGLTTAQLSNAGTIVYMQVQDSGLTNVISVDAGGVDMERAGRHIRITSDTIAEITGLIIEEGVAGLKLYVGTGTSYMNVGTDDFTFVANVVLENETADTIAHFNTNKNLKSLDTATYPSLAELSYVKGVTSSIQTQLNALTPPATTDNLTEGSTNLYFTAARVLAVLLTGFSAGANTAIAATDTLAQALAKIQGQINARANETATSIAGIINAVSAKTTPVDADEFTGTDSANSNALTRVTWANIKATLKTYFDSVTTTLTNKRITARTGTTTSSATPTINTDNVDFYSITALATAITSFTTNLSGTPTEGQTLWIAITDDGTARAITWGSSFESSGNIALPTTTVISTRLDVAFIWNTVTSKWRCVGVA